MLVYGMGCSYTGWGVNIWDGVVVYGRGESIWDGVLVYDMEC